MNRKAALATACVILFTLGAFAAAVGPALDELAENAGTDLAGVGALFTVMFIGSLAAQVIAGPLIDRIGQRPVMVAAILLVVPSYVGITLSHSVPMLLAFGVIAGLGFAALDVSCSVLVAQLFAGQESVAALNWLHLFFGIGAVIAPAVAGLFLRVADTALPALWITGAVLALTLPLLIRLKVRPAVIPASAGETNASLNVYRQPLLWAVGVLLLLYVGAETGIGGWLTTYIERSTTQGAEAGALITSGFWLALSAGRLAIARAGNRYTPQTVLWISLAGSLGGGLLLPLATGSVAVTIGAVMVIGFFFGPIFPTIVALITDIFRRSPGKAVSTAMAMGSVGGAVLPWVQGALLDRISPSASVILVAAITLAMLATWATIQRQHPTAAPG